MVLIKGISIKCSGYREVNEMKIATLLLLTSVMAFRLHAQWGFQCLSQAEYMGFPHQITVADMICTGTVLTNNRDYAVLSIDELFWGNTTSSNITVKSLQDGDSPAFVEYDRYLVFAYTNNWWGSNKVWLGYIWDTANKHLLDFRPYNGSTNASSFFDDYMILNSSQSVINIKSLRAGETNYWPATRKFITDFIKISRVMNDKAEAFRYINYALSERDLSKMERHHLRKYRIFHWSDGGALTDW